MERHVDHIIVKAYLSASFELLVQLHVVDEVTHVDMDAVLDATAS